MNLDGLIDLAVLGRASLESHFQPKVSLAVGHEVAAYEALLRVRTKSGRLIHPGPIFSELDRMPRREADLSRRLIAAAMLAQAGRASAILRREVSINIDPCMLADPCFVEMVAAEPRPGLPITLEIVEIATSKDIRQVARGAKMLRAHGYKIALDDFGSAESNLGRLASIEVDEVKIDASLLDTRRGRLMLPALVQMIGSLGSIACIEGVEAADHHTAARDAGAALGQGFYYGPPGPIAGA